MTANNDPIAASRRPTLDQTHTYAVALVTRSTYNEIAKIMHDAGYEHVFHENGIIDMHGIALQTEERSDEED